MQMIDSFVDVEIKLASFRQLAHRVSSLPAPFRPTYFTVGERVRNKSASRVDDTERFSAFVEDHVS
jgi:hypothetical protein